MNVTISESDIKTLEQLKKVLSGISTIKNSESEKYKKVLKSIIEQQEDAFEENEYDNITIGKNPSEDISALEQQVNNLQRQVDGLNEFKKKYQYELNEIKQAFKVFSVAIIGSNTKIEEKSSQEYNKAQSEGKFLHSSNIRSEDVTESSKYENQQVENSQAYESEQQQISVDNNKSIVDKAIINEFMNRYNNGYIPTIALSLPSEVADKRARGIQAKSEDESKAIALSKSDAEAFYYADPVEAKPPYYFVTPDLDEDTFNYKKSLQCGFEDFYDLESDKDVRNISSGKAKLIRPAIFEKKSNEKYYMARKGILEVD